MPFWENRRNFLLLIVLMAVHLVLISVQIPRGSKKTLFENAVFFVFSPVQRVFVGGLHGLESAWTGYFDLRGARREAQELRKELFFLNQEKRFLEDRLQFFEAEALIQQNLAAYRKSLIRARVVGSDPVNIYQTIIVDRGYIDGVEEDMAVCDKFGNLLGRTIKPVGPKEVVVQLITDKESSVSVISPAGQIIGSLTGTSSFALYMMYVPSSAPGGREGEEVVTTGYDKIYPAGIRVGRIKSVTVDEAAPIFKKIEVYPYFRFAALDAVAILPKGRGGRS